MMQAGPPHVDTDEPMVKSVDKTLRLIELLNERGEGRVTELAEHTGYSKGTVHKHLATLEQHEFVVKEDGVYRPGLRFLDIGGKLRTRIPLSREIKQRIRELGEITNEVAQFAVLDYGKVVTVYRESGREGVQTKIHVGKRLPANQLAGGKAILSQMPESDVEAIIDRFGLPEATPNTFTDREQFKEELAEVRDQGYAINREETIRGLMGVSVPVVPDMGQPEILGACTVSGPTHRLSEERLNEEIAETLLSVVNALELNISYS